MEYKILFLDLDNTLLDFYKAEATAIRQVLKEFGLPFDDETVKLYSKVNLSYWKRFERGEIPKDEIFEGRFKTLLSLLDKKGDTKAICDSYCKKLAEGYFVMEGAKDILCYLKAKGYRLIATTNGFAITQYNRVERSGLAPYFERVIISEELGCQKPEREYFRKCMELVGEDNPERILIVGDSQSSDILGGINAGIDTCWFNLDNAEPKYKSKYEIKKLEELKNIL